MKDKSKRWIWKSLIAGLSGSIAHSSLMYLKSRTGLLPSFEPYTALQISISNAIGTHLPLTLIWAFSFLNGAMILGGVFGGINQLLPGKSGMTKGLVFGFIGWLVMGLIFFPLIGLGPFAVRASESAFLFSLAMLLIYSVVMGVVYSWIEKHFAT